MIRRLILLAPLLGAIATSAFAEIGRVKSSVGVATVERSGERLPATSGQALLPGDWLETGKDSRISLTFVDDTRFAVGPDSRIALTKYEYDRTSQKGSFVAQIERGSIAVVSGRITKSGRDGMQIRTPDSVLAVRGTRFIVTVPR